MYCQKLIDSSYKLFGVMRLILLTVILTVTLTGLGGKKKNDEPQGMLFGDEDASVEIIEYASLSCPHCAHFHSNVYPQLKRDFLDKGIAKLYVRDFPHNNIGVTATLALRCADESVRPDLYSVLLENQDSWVTRSNVRHVLRDYAALAGVDSQRLDTCWQDKKMISDLFVDLKAAEKQGIRSIPTVFINGKQVAADYAAIAKAIEAAR